MITIDRGEKKLIERILYECDGEDTIPLNFSSTTDIVFEFIQNQKTIVSKSKSDGEITQSDESNSAITELDDSDTELFSIGSNVTLKIIVEKADPLYSNGTAKDIQVENFASIR